MKKIIPVAAFLFLLFGCSTTQEYRSQPNLVPYSFENSIGKEEAPLLSDEEKAWLLALPAIIIEPDFQATGTLEFEPKSPSTDNHWKELLAELWRIRNREELLNSISRLEYQGDRYTCFSLISQKEDPDPRFILTGPRQRSMVFLENNYQIYKSTDLAAWDLGRIVQLIRWGYQVGYLTESESWNMLSYYGWRIGGLYDSWEQYGAAFRLGRIFWASAGGREEETQASTDEVMLALYDKSGLWKKTKWIKNPPPPLF